MKDIVGVIVAAGYGTRFLPITRVVPKELLPLVDRPAIDFIVEELVNAGVSRIVVITSRRKKSLDDWFDHDAELEAVFTREGATQKLAKAQPPKVPVQFVRQTEMAGTGDALLRIRDAVGDHPFIVAYPDDIFGEPNCSAQLIETWRETGKSVMSAMDLTGQDVSRYGVLDAAPAGSHFNVKAIVEKPPKGTEPSHLISLGRYLYTPAIFEHLDAARAKHTTGEFYPTDAVNTLAAAGGVVARVVDAPRWDTGVPLGYVQAMIDVALRRDDIGGEVRAWLTERLAQPD